MPPRAGSERTRPAGDGPGAVRAGLCAALLLLLALPLLLSASTPGASSPPADEPEARLGHAVYQRRCARCHATGMHREGPAHCGVVGRAAATQPGFRYSEALRRSGITWTPAELDAWLSDPESRVPGQAMDVQVSSPVARRRLIAYLATLEPCTPVAARRP
ncbi:c-type cytochrome [Piscinibacter sakaiensis]|uniref:c-type cytochrome n=1 Tax=Piscinibacter sakaiensis TaxID=1547922 RepID=UPI001E49C888|nr:cytochrome C [Piscinibacter sakaiensis]